MIGPEVMRAFRRWARGHGFHKPGMEPGMDVTGDCYPLYIGHELNGRWYVRERMPGTRVWRAEEDGSFTLLDNSSSFIVRNIDTLKALAST